MGRLHGEAGGGAWCPAQVVTNTSRPEWLMVDLEEELRLTGVIVQGRWDRGLGQEWAQEVKIQTWAQESGDWVTQGADRRLANTDTLTPALVRLEPPALARRLRVIPVSEHARTVCIRLEICGCNMEEMEMVETFEDVHDEVHDVSEEVHLRPQVTSAHISSSDKSSRGYEPGYMSMVIAVLVSVILILTLVIIFILYNNSNRSASQQQQTTAPVSQHSYSEYQALPPADYVSHYSNDSNYSEYSRPLLGLIFSPKHFIFSPSDTVPPFSAKYFRPEQWSAPGPGVWVLSRSQNALGHLLAPASALLKLGPSPASLPASTLLSGSHFFS